MGRQGLQAPDEAVHRRAALKEVEVRFAPAIRRSESGQRHGRASCHSNVAGPFVLPAHPAMAVPNLFNDHMLPQVVNVPVGAAGEACPLLLASAGGRTSEPAAVRGDAGSACAATGADGIESGQLRQQRNLSTKSWGGEVLRKRAGIWGISAIMLRIVDRWGGPD